ncbi:hypothetical protein PG984_014232 [Apiospora sp. TS-2023a]
MPVIPVTFPSFTQNITIPIDLDPNPISGLKEAIRASETMSADTVIDGLAAIGLSKGWVTLLHFLLVIAVIWAVGGSICACIMAPTEFARAKRVQVLVCRIDELEKRLRDRLDKTSEKDDCEITGRPSDTTLSKARVE